MSPVRTAEHQRVKDIVAVRNELDDRVGSKADILGSMVGIKMRRGKLTGTIGMTYFVKAKVPKAELSPHRRVPGRLKSGDLWVGTDVIEWPRMVKQSGADPLIISDSVMQGTLGCFGASDAGVFGISAAHCLLGADGNPSTPTEVAYFGAQQQQWITAGESIALGYSPGLGVPGNYGSLDCGLFGLQDASLAAMARAGQPLMVVDDLHSLVAGSTVFATSTLRPAGSTNPLREATVHGVEGWALNQRFDIVLLVEPPGTFRGDSGMLWLTQDGRAVALHTDGEEMPGMQGSTLVGGMSAVRMANYLDVRLILG